MTELQHDTFASPVGTIMLFARNGVLVHLDFEDCPGRIERLLERRFGTVTFSRVELDEPKQGLADYFAGNINALDRLEVDPGGTEFQNRLWLALRGIAGGTTASYADMAIRIGKPRAVRAVGRTNGLNPIALVLPCHRVIGKDGSLTGYAGGLERKAWLLRHEGALL